MSTARLLRAAGSAQQSAEHAEAAGACSSEPCRCWSHGELRHDLARLSIPGDSLARPSVRPWGTFSCRPTTPRAHATNSCMGPVAAAGLPPAPSRSRAQPVGYPDPFFILLCPDLVPEGRGDAQAFAYRGIVVVRGPVCTAGTPCVGPSDTMPWSPTIGLLITRCSKSGPLIP